MGLESGSTISALDKDWPLADDPINKGDDHLRLLKAVLKTQFPGGGNNGLDEPLLANEHEFNALVGVTANIQDQFEAVYAYQVTIEGQLNAPKDTYLLFHSTTVPNGWATVHYGADSMLRIIDPRVNDSGAFMGGDSPIQFYGGHNHTTGDFKLQEAHIPSHSHAYGPFTGTGGASSALFVGALATPTKIETDPTGGDQVHNHGNTGAGGADWFPRYVPGVIGVRIGDIAEPQPGIDV